MSGAPVALPDVGLTGPVCDMTWGLVGERDTWSALIARVREAHSGLVTYNCDKCQEDRLTWWDAVDVRSSSGFYPNGAEQAQYFDGVVLARRARDWVRGFMLWEWPAAPYPAASAQTNADYCVYSTPAALTVSRGYRAWRVEEES